MVVKWQTVKELREGEFRIREEDGKCFLERRVIGIPEDVISECTAELYSGPFSSPAAYIRLMHEDKVIAIVRPNSGIDIRADRYEVKPVGTYSFAIMKS